MLTSHPAKILEIFRSIQGEGPYLGVAQVFVRFFECNMHCTWCDTPASIGDTTRNYKEMGTGDIVKQATALYKGCHSVSITGGEPLLQVDVLKEILPQLRRMGMKIYLETNGVLPQALAQIINDVDIISMDLKLPSSTKEKAFWVDHEVFLCIANQRDVFVKAVITHDTTEDDLKKAVELVARIDKDMVFILQPNYFDMKESGVSIAKCVGFQQICLQNLTDVRIIPQVHKFMKLR